MASRACCSASASFNFLKEPHAFSYWLLAFAGTPSLIALTVAPRTSGRSHGRQASSSTTTGFASGSGVEISTSGCELGRVHPGWIAGGTGRLLVPPPGVPRDPPDPPPVEPPFCARIGKADRAIARVQNATGFKRAIPGWLRRAIIRLILYLFFVVSRISFQINGRVEVGAKPGHTTRAKFRKLSSEIGPLLNPCGSPHMRRLCYR